jgi:predicted phosphodiesterase
MKLQPMSDLHIRFPGARGFPPLVPGVGAVLIAGDTCEGLGRALHAMRAAYPKTEIITVAGNHEFYGTTYPEELAAGRETARALGIHFIENDTVFLGRLKVVGASLWTDYDLAGERLREAAMRAAYDSMRDHKRIKWSRDPWMRFRPQEARMLHLQSRAYIEGELGRGHVGTTLVLSHHGPTIVAVRPEFRTHATSAAYASDLHSVIDSYQPDFWISGHTHFPMDLRRGRTRLISNPCGYGDENTSFDPALTIEVDA